MKCEAASICLSQALAVKVDLALRGIAWHCMAWHGMAWHGMALLQHLKPFESLEAWYPSDSCCRSPLGSPFFTCDDASIQLLGPWNLTF